MTNLILLVLDDSNGALEVANIALELAALKRSVVSVIYIVDQGWIRILGDEWLSTGKARTSFTNWFENELTVQAKENLELIIKKSRDTGVSTTTDIMFGRPEKIIIDAINSSGIGLLVLPHSYSKIISPILKHISCPVLLGPNKNVT